MVVRLAAPPVDGAANQALLDWLSRQLNVPKHAVRLVSGERARLKRVAIDGVTVESVAALCGVPGRVPR